MRIRKRVHQESTDPSAARNAPTVYEVAARAGVSTASVSRVLAGHDRVRPDTRARVLDAVSELGYVPSGAAQDLAGRRTSVLGLCFPDLVGDRDIIAGAQPEPGRVGGEHPPPDDTMYWYDEVIRGMERAARRSGYALLIAASHESDDANLVLTVAGRCDGLVILAGTAPMETVEHIAARVPVVLLASPRDAAETPALLDHLWVDNERGMHELTAHVLDAHRYDDVCFVAGPEDSRDSQSRFDGFRAACLERGRPAPERPEYRGDFTTAGGAAVVAQLLAEGRMPRALLCANDQTAIGAMSALRQARRRIPTDVAVTGFDGVHVGRHLHPGLTTVVQPMRELGESAVRMLQRRITDAAADGQDIQLPVRVQLHGSCGCRSRSRD